MNVQQTERDCLIVVFDYRASSYYKVNRKLFLIDHFNGLIELAEGERESQRSKESIQKK